MAAPSEDDFDRWLSEKLQKINEDVDLEVFVTYIRGVLETESDDEDKDEAITGILGEITEDSLEMHCSEITKKWADLDKALADEKQKKEAHNIEEQLSSMIGKTNITVVKQKEISAEEKARKDAILAQYAQVSDGEGSEQEGATGGSGDLSKISNAQGVVAREKEMRERSKQESDQKKLKDKEDREKQKQKAVDRKEKEKTRTQKGERRR